MTPVDSGGKLLKYRRGPGEAAWIKKDYTCI